MAFQVQLGFSRITLCTSGEQRLLGPCDIAFSKFTALYKLSDAEQFKVFMHMLYCIVRLQKM
jgi:hypothetical protein